MEELRQKSRPVHDTFWRRTLTLAAVKLVTTKGLRRMFKHPRGVLLISKYCVKTGPFTTLAEANAMQFVRQNTSIPVPTVYCAFIYKGRTYIVMERVHGEPLGTQWIYLAEQSKARILSHLKKMIEELRAIKPPKDIGVANIDGGPIYDCRLPKDHTWGPFKTIHEFHRQLRAGVESSHLNVPPDIRELIAFPERPWSSPVFTHADLSSFNILRRGDKVVGIIDWESAGWFPTYWEYTTASNVNPQNEFWRQEIDRFLTPMPYELKMENVRRKYFGDY